MRRRVHGWRAAERREQAIRAAEGSMEPDDAMRAAFELCDLVQIDLRQPDVTRAREVENARRIWHTLRTRLMPR